MTTRILAELVQIEAYSGDEKPVADYLEAKLHELGYDRVWRDHCGNVMGRMSGKSGSGRKLLFDAHMDVVRVSERWTKPPFQATVEGSRMYGRGTADMKGAMAAVLAGVAFAKQEGTIVHDVYVSFTVGEEFHEGIALKEVMNTVRPDAVVICEPTDLKVNIAQRGRAEITIEAIGKAAHAASPQVGINALKHMSHIVTALDRMEQPEDPFMGTQLIEPTECITSPYPGISIVPHNCRTRWDKRLLLGQDERNVLDDVHAVIERLQQTIPDLEAYVQVEEGEFHCYTGHLLKGKKFLPPWKTDESEPLVQAAIQACSDAGISPRLGSYGFCTNGSYSAGTAGVTTIGFGPGKEQHAHIDDEFIELQQLADAVCFYSALSSSDWA